jgi:hypothetical protein
MFDVDAETYPTLGMGISIIHSILWIAYKSSILHTLVMCFIKVYWFSGSRLKQKIYLIYTQWVYMGKRYTCTTLIQTNVGLV